MAEPIEWVEIPTADAIKQVQRRYGAKTPKTAEDKAAEQTRVNQDKQSRVQRSNEKPSVAPPAVQEFISDEVNTELDAIDQLFKDDPANADIANQLRELTITQAKERLDVAGKVNDLPANMASGIAQMPTDVPGIVDLVRAGGASVANSVMPDDKEDGRRTFGERVVKEFNKQMFVEDGDKAIAAKAKEKFIEIAKANPNLAESDLMSRFDEYQRGDEFQEFIVSKLSPGIRLTMQGNAFWNEVFGLDKRPDQQSETDDLVQVISQAFISTAAFKNPVNAVAKATVHRIPSRIVKSVIKQGVEAAQKARATKAGRVVSTAGELLLPGTSPYTKGRVAANAAVGGVTVDVMRRMQGMPNIGQDVLGTGALTPSIAEAMEPHPEMPQAGTLMPDVANGEPPHGHGENIEAQIDEEVALGGLTSAAFFGIPAVRRAAAQQARTAAQAAARNAQAPTPPPPIGHNSQAAQQGVNAANATPPNATQLRVAAQTGTDAGPSRPKQQIDADRTMKPVLSKFTGMTDSNAPARQIVNMFKPLDDVTSVDTVDHLMSSGAHIKRNEAYANLMKHGKLINHPDTVPLEHIEQKIKALEPEDQEKFTKYIYAKQADQGIQQRTKELRAEALDANNHYRIAAAKNDRRAATAALKRYNKANDQLTNIGTDAPTSRPSMRGWTKAMRDQYIAEGNASPAVADIVRDIQRFTRDVLATEVQNGRRTTNDAIEMLANNEVYVPLKERAYADLFEGTRYEKGMVRDAAAKGLMFKDRVLGSLDFKTKDAKAFYTPDYSRNVTEDKTSVNRPMHPMYALRMYAQNSIGDVVTNNSRRDIIDKFVSLPGAEGVALKKFMFNVGNGRQTHSLSRGQFAIPSIRKQLTEHNANNPNSQLVRVVRDGRYEFWQMADPVMARTIQFFPAEVVPILNLARKLKQIGTTGWMAPWFAPVSMLRDVTVARVMKPDRYSLGIEDTYGRKLLKGLGASEEYANAVMSRVPSFTALPTVMAAIPYKMTMDLTEQIATKISKDLRLQSGIFNTIAQVSGGQAYLQNIGRYMQKAFDDSAYKVYKYQSTTSASHLVDGMKVVADYNVEEAGKISKAFGVMTGTFKYIAASIQESTRVAFVTQNFKKGMTKAQVDDLIHVSNNLTADLTRVSADPRVQRFLSVVPFGNAALQGTRNLWTASVPAVVAKAVNKAGKAVGHDFNIIEKRSDRFWTAIATEVAMPVVISLAIIDNWEGFSEFYYNQVPDWQRNNSVALPSYKALQYMEENDGELPPFHPDYVNFIPLSPEFSIFKAMISAGLRSAGLTGPSSQHVPYSAWKDLKAGMASYIPTMSPPPIDVLAATGGQKFDPTNIGSGDPLFQEIRNPAFQGGNPDMMNFNSAIPQAVEDMVGAIIGGAGNIITQSAAVGMQTLEETENLSSALWDGARVGWQEIKEKAPIIDIPVLYDAARRYYTNNPEGEYVHETEATLEPIMQQHSVESDRKDRAGLAEEMGNAAPPKVRDPFLSAVSTYVYEQTRMSGPYKSATDAYSEIRAQLDILEANRGGDKSNLKYQQERNKMILVQQNLNKSRAKVLYGMEKQLNQLFGPEYEKRFGEKLTYESLSNMVRADVTQQRKDAEK